jgi:hypothetical protein
VDGATPRPAHINSGVECVSGTADGKQIYFGEAAYLLDAMGLHYEGNGIPGFPVGGCAAYSNGSIYGANGDIVDAVTGVRIGAFPASGRVHAVPQTNQTYFLTAEGSLGSETLRFLAFDDATGAQLHSQPLPIGYVGTYGRLVDWGIDGIAFGDYSGYTNTGAKWLYLMHIASWP